MHEYLNKIIIEALNPIAPVIDQKALVDLSEQEQLLLHKYLYIIGVDLEFSSITNFNFNDLHKNYNDTVNTYKEKLNNTLKTIHAISTEIGVPFVIFKTLSPIDYTKGDIDIYIKEKDDFSKFCEKLSTYGFKTGHTFHAEIEFKHPHHLKIDMHNDITWDFIGRGGDGPNLVDTERLWERRQSSEYTGVQVTIPSAEDEILTILAHSAFQHHYLTLGDGLFVGELIRNNKIDFEYIYAMSTKYGWNGALKEFMGVIKTWYQTYWKIELDIPEKTRQLKQYQIYYTQSFLGILINAETPRNVKDITRICLTALISIYRYVRYIKFKNELPFNPYDY